MDHSSFCIIVKQIPKHQLLIHWLNFLLLSKTQRSRKRINMQARRGKGFKTFFFWYQIEKHTRPHAHIYIYVRTAGVIFEKFYESSVILFYACIKVSFSSRKQNLRVVVKREPFITWLMKKKAKEISFTRKKHKLLF